MAASRHLARMSEPQGRPSGMPPNGIGHTGPHDDLGPDLPEPRGHPPAFNVPGVVLALLALLAAIHVATVFLAPSDGWGWWVPWLSFVPGFITFPAAETELGMTPWWSFVTYGLFHGDALHLATNGLWLLAMGSPVARRFGTGRFLAFIFAGTVAGAVAHYVVDPRALVPMIGASGAVSALFGAAMRFALAGRGLRGPDVHLRPRLSLVEAFSDRTVLSFVLIWLAINYVFGAGLIPIPGAEGGIAWQAHMGGFALGLFGFALFDPIGSDGSETRFDHRA